MLRIRSIHYNAFKSSKLARLSAEAERLWWRIQCLCDDDGRAEDDPEVMCGYVFPKRRDITPAEVDGWMAELDAVGLIVRYEVPGGRAFAVHQWHEYQHPRRPNKSSIPPPPAGPRRTTTDHDGQSPQEGRGEERRGIGEGGESEGRAAPSPVHPQAVGNPALRQRLASIEAGNIPTRLHAVGEP